MTHPAASNTAGDWAQHEHVADPIEIEARRLISAAGSPDLAKQAVESAAESQSRGPTIRSLEELAVQAGFASRMELLAASTPLNAPDGALWWATAVKGNRWIVWRLEELAIEPTFASQEEIQQYLECRARPVLP